MRPVGEGASESADCECFYCRSDVRRTHYIVCTSVSESSNILEYLNVLF